MIQRHKQRRTSRELREELRHIYVERDGNVPNLTRIDHADGSRATRFLVRIILVLLVLSLASWGGFFLWSRGMFLEGKPLQTSVDGLTNVKSGEPLEFTIRYQNVGRVPLASLEFKLNAPPNFHLISADPPPTEVASWTVGSLTEGSDGAVIIKGIFLSEVPNISTLQAFFTYRPANFNSDFQDILTIPIAISDSIIASAITGPEQTTVGDEVTYTINVQNTSQTPTERVKCQATLPADFVATYVAPASETPDTLSWSLPRIKANGIAVITIKGRYTVAASGEQIIGFKTGLMDEDVFLLQSQSDAKTDVKGGNVSFRVLTNGSSSNQSSDLGDVINTSISYENNGNDTIQDLSFSLALEPPEGKTLPVEWSAKTLGGGTRKNNTVVWDRSAIPTLATLSPKETGIIDLRFSIATALKEKMGDRFAVKLSATYVHSVIGARPTKRTITTSPFMIFLNSEPDTAEEISQ